jgi:hypothetical protein
VKGPVPDDIVHGVLIGRGRISRAREATFAADESGHTKQVINFLDAVMASFDDLRRLAEDDPNVTAPYLRKTTLLGSATMLRVLAIVWHELRQGDPDNGIPAKGAGEIEAFYKELAPRMDLDEWEVDGTKEQGVKPDNAFWMSTGAFMPGAKAPNAQNSAISDIADALVKWAREGLPERA